MAGVRSGRAIRLAVIVEFFPPRLGSDRRIYELLTRVREPLRPYFIRVFPFRGFFEPDLAGGGPVPAGEAGAPEMEHDLISLPRSLVGLQGLVLFPIVLLFSLIHLLQLLKGARPGVLILNYPSPYTGLLGFLAARMRGIPLLVDFNDLISDYIASSFRFANNRPMRLLLRRVERFLVAYSEGVIAANEYLRRVAQGYHPMGSLAKIPNGVDTERFRPPPAWDEKASVAAYCGRLEGWAGIELLEGISRLRLEKDVELQVAGVGSRAPASGDFHYVGELAPRDIPAFLTPARYVLVPFAPEEMGRAASPLKLFEGLAVGSVVLCSDLDGIREVITDGENGFLLASNDPAEWASKIEDLERDEGLRLEVQKRARETAVGHDWTKLARKLEDFVQRMLSA